MEKMQRPKVVMQPVGNLREDDLRRVVCAREGSDFRDRRDTALVLFLVDTGCRLDEMTRLDVDDLELDQGTATVLGKGGRHRLVGLGRKTLHALDCYIRVRRSHPRTRQGSVARHEGQDDQQRHRAGHRTSRPARRTEAPASPSRLHTRMGALDDGAGNR
ncbi:MAG: tyrosine-type recombinase/integrase [Terriglobales bacterium]